MGIVVMLNNLFHDFAVALLAACLFILYFIYRTTLPGSDNDRMELVKRLYGKIGRIIIGCWVVIVLGGAVRTWAFEEYEWMAAAGRGQIAALIVKHIILVSLVVMGTIVQRKLKKIIAS